MSSKASRTHLNGPKDSILAWSFHYRFSRRIYRLSAGAAGPAEEADKTRVRSHLVKISNSVSPKAGNPSMVGNATLPRTLYSRPFTLTQGLSVDWPGPSEGVNETLRRLWPIFEVSGVPKGEYPLFRRGRDARYQAPPAQIRTGAL